MGKNESIAIHPDNTTMYLITNESNVYKVIWMNKAKWGNVYLMLSCVSL